MTPAPSPAEPPRPRPLSPGHAGRLRLPSMARWLIAGQLMVMAMSLQDKEIALALAEAAGLGPRGAFAIEVGLSLSLLAAWAGLTLGWVRLACGRRDPPPPA